MAEAGPSSQNTTARPDPSKPPGIGQCGSAGCICCKHIWRGHDQFQSTTTKQRYKITQHLTCKTPSVVYIIECKKCPVQYVGKTSTTLQRRFGDYRASIKRCQHRPIADHFNQKSHTINDLIIYPIKQVCGYKALKKEQDHWIRELRTFDHGLNLESYKHGKYV
ncbi:hypothetical protein JZ751_003466 [Albula glossodonta]|uniref:GIY-YIG domain-containing protein n=1 Tax=Albula glossodonta TaxID=121402 RepID=A0A8T2MQZ5_9TELE|nr:hypothetical protein JZ751_003466 [Albula glossodonta]